MTVDPPDGDPSTDPSGTSRYGRLSLADDSVIVYDRDRVDAWIQSSVAYDLPPRESSPNADRVDSGGADTGVGGD
ncbi:hypothetical protein [Halobaculum rubrum]|uniref:hypothetical protein n=1 Tax=Halobaculum rubrum TaxID=2872158 RepID=UPI001CA43E86|nr:hypothetical protein [Halobaculum rubrum]QZX99098.1 hypothetical protein K6T25_12670 [Halobaculum rubrum]